MKNAREQRRKKKSENAEPRRKRDNEGANLPAIGITLAQAKLSPGDPKNRREEVLGQILSFAQYEPEPGTASYLCMSASRNAAHTRCT